MYLQKEIKKVRKRKEVKNEAKLRAMSDPDEMWALRMKFIDQLRKYFGVPYAKRYWKPDGKDLRICLKRFLIQNDLET